MAQCDKWECAIPVVPPQIKKRRYGAFFIVFAFSYLVFYDLRMKYIDAHCHILTDAQMRDAVLHGVGRFIVNATRPADWDAVVDLARCDDVYGAVGVHPWFVSELRDGWDGMLINALGANPNLMVGEIGLDKNRPDMELQESVFCRQLQIACDLNRVAHIHCVGVWGRMIDILRGVELPPAMVFHAFSGAPELVPELVEMNAYFSFGVSVADSTRARLRAAVAVVPSSRILVESDAPDMEMPATVPTTVAEIARIRGANAGQLAETIYNNTMVAINGGKI